MSLPFIQKHPNKSETEIFRLALSTFCDGSGQQKDPDGSTRPGWRDFERLVAEIYNGEAPEGKSIFDVLVPDPVDEKIVYGVSCKSKELKRKTAISDLEANGRVYMELSNSPAYFWGALKPKGIAESDFSKNLKAQTIGQTIIEVVNNWHSAYAKEFNANTDKILNLGASVHLVLSMSPLRNSVREYIIHSFEIPLDQSIRWEYSSPRCLRGYDPDEPNEAILDWYGLSGGQLKYYPRAQSAKFCSQRFVLESPPTITILDKAKSYFPKNWSQTGR